jgi:hypothetical protein
MASKQHRRMHSGTSFSCDLPQNNNKDWNMSDTYDSAAEAAADRMQQQALLAALGAWDRALRRDECGAWCISGNTGSIHTWGNGKSWVLFVACRSSMHWTYTKRQLSFCTVSQDGEDEGCFRLHTLPTLEQASVIRDVLGIRKRTVYAPESLARLQARVADWSATKPLRNDELQP